MRRLLGVLRSDPEDDGGPGPALGPAPGLGGIDRLVDDVRAAGLPVRLTVSGAARALPSTLDTTAYRVVQESLTNVLKHAVDPTAVGVRLQWRDEDVVIQVSDDGRGTPAGGPLGHGLTGMRERLGVFGGSMSSGPGRSGGWVVSAVLPVPGEDP
jgi:signal transduction histidine kinase